MSITFLPWFSLILAAAFQDVTPPPLAHEGFSFSTDVQLVVLDAGVTDAKGETVSGLRKDDFRVYEDNKLQSIKYLSHSDIPVTIGLVIDNSGSMRSKRSEVVTAALTLIRESNPHDEAFAVTFNDRVHWGLPLDTPFTSDMQILREALMNGKPQGRTALYDALAGSLRHLSLGRMEKKTLVVVSDGGDNASKLHWDDLLTAVRKSQATIYTIDIVDENDPDRHPDVIKKLAQVSGGQYFRVEALPEIEVICQRIAADIRSRYTIAYTPSHVGVSSSTHLVKVTASTPSRQRLTVRTRSQYVSPALTPASSVTKGASQ